MDEDSHCRRQVVNTMEIAFDEGAEVPQAGVDLLEGLGQVILVLRGLLAFGVVQPRAAESGQVFIVGAGPVAAVDPVGEGLIHRGQRRYDPRGRVCVLDVVAQVLELFFLRVEVRLEIGVSEHGFDTGVEVVVLHELVVEVERDGKPVGDSALREA